MISLKGISKKYGDAYALRNTDLDIVGGEWLGLVGPNGSGKTTMIRILLGLTQPTTGGVRLDGKIPGRERWLSLKARVGFMPERIQIYENLTAEETLRYIVSIRGIPGERIPELLAQVGLADAAQKRVGEYSKGMRQRLNLAQALVGDPDVLILDEPTEGLDPHGVRQFFQLLRSSGEQQKTVLLSSHRLSEMEEQVDRVCILGEGQIKTIGTPRELMARLKLSVRVHIILANGHGGGQESQLGDLGFAASQAGEKRLTATVPYDKKIRVVGKLYAMGLDLEDLWIEEPDLEEIYFEAH